MKKLVALLVFALAATAFAGDTAWYNTDTQTLQWQRPARVTVNGTDYGPNPHPDLVVAAGWQSLALDCAWTDTVTDWEESPPVRCMTDQELDAREAARLEAEAQAEAAATLPIQSATGFAVLDNDGHWVELEPTGDGLPVIGVQISNSPLTPEERAAMKAERKAARDALKEAAQNKKLNDKDKVALLMRAVFGVEE